VTQFQPRQQVVAVVAVRRQDELVLIAAGSSARSPKPKDRPVDHVICGIVDTVERRPHVS
jgi:microcompartment protein CcmK/EutM